MHKLSERGVAHLLVPLILLIGIIGGVYLVQQTQIFKPKASLGINISFVDDSGNNISSTASNIVKIKVVSPEWVQPTPSPSLTPSPTLAPTPPPISTPTPTPTPSPTPTPTIIPSPSLTPTPSPAACSVGDVNGDGKVDVVDSQLVLRIVAGLTTPTDQQNKDADVDGDGQVTSVDALKIQRVWAGLDKTFPVCASVQGVSTDVITASIVLAEDPNFTVNKQTVSFTTDPITYTFSTSNPGTKTLYAKFVASDGQEQNASPFPATISLTAVSTPSPSPSPSPTSSINVTVTSVNKTLTPGQNAIIFQIISYNGIDGGLQTYPVNSTQKIKVDTVTAKTQNIPNAYIQDVTLRTDASLEAGIYTGAICVTDSSGKCVINVPLTLTIPSSTQAVGYRVFITSTKYNGNLGGLSGADQKCQDRASTANLGGIWKAWLSTNAVSASSRLNHSSVPYMNYNSPVSGIARNWTDLTNDNYLLGPIGFDEYYLAGAASGNAWPGASVWTDTNVSGNSSNIGDCSGWTSSSVGSSGGSGRAGYDTREWTNPSSYGDRWSCDNVLRLYCFEQSPGISGPTPSPTPTPSILPVASSYKRVFKTDNYNLSGGFYSGFDYKGLSAADDICQHAASNASLGGIWKAWLSDSKTSAASRLTHASVPYKRLDGVAIANNWSDLTDGSLQSTLNVTEYGAKTVDAGAWTNTKYDGNIKYTDQPHNCNDWTTTSNASGSQGHDFNTNTGWTDVSTYPCGFLDSLYCFEQ